MPRQAIIACLTISTFACSAQVNSWLKPASGNWEEPQWSLGVLPGSFVVVAPLTRSALLGQDRLRRK